MGRVILFVTAPAARESASPRAAPTDPGPRTGAHTRYWAKHLSPATRGVARHYILRALRVHRDEESSSSERFVFSRVEMGGSRFLEIREALCQNSAPGRGWRSQTTLPPPTYLLYLFKLVHIQTLDSQVLPYEDPDPHRGLQANIESQQLTCCSALVWVELQ